MKSCFLFLLFVVSGLTARATDADSLLAQMTHKEKVQLVIGGGWGSLFSGFNLPFCGKQRVPGAAGMTHAVKRLGIPSVVMADGPAGVRIKPLQKRNGKKREAYATAFPVGCCLASSWDTALLEEVGAAIGDEAAAYGIDIILSPGMNLMRSPLCGRNYEYYSEDPLLSGKLAAATVRGIQSNGIGASIKHFACNNQETGRMHNDSRVDSATLFSLYLRPFEIAIRESDPWTVMSSYNLLNGERTQESRWLLTEVLRRRWRYRGLVMTDWTFRRHTRRQIAAGNDLMMPGDALQRCQLKKAFRSVENGENMLDTCARHVLQMVLKTRSARGLQATGEPHLEEHARLARRAAAESFVLLHNEGGALPFSPKARVALFGASSYDLVAGGTGSGHVNAAYKMNLSDALPHCVGARLIAEYRRWAQGNTHRNKAAGFGFMQKFLGRGALKEMPLKREWITEALDSADIALITVGRQAGEGRDRQPTDFELTREERDMLQQVSQEARMRGIQTVVVLNVSGVIETASWRHLADAVLLIWCPGQEGGAAAADVLTGVVNPSGRLTMTWPERLEDLPSTLNFGNERVTLYAERDSVGYRAFRDGVRRPAYAFGHGLSYSAFREELLADGRIAVTNTGDRPGRHVVMWWEEGVLTAFAKTRLLAPGECQVLGHEQTAVTVGKEAEVVGERVVIDAAPVAVNEGADQ